jgi:hypothetical protein
MTVTRRSRRRRITAVLAVLLVALLVAPAASYVNALTAPGSATLGMRTVDWVRSHHGGGVVNAIENWYYTRSKPSTNAPDPAALPHSAPSTSAKRDTAPPAALPTLPGVTKLPGESTWTPGRDGRQGQPLIYTGYLRPDAQHLSVVAGVAWMRTDGSTAHLVAGTMQPGGSGWPGNAAVPASDTANLVATFNSGFKLADISGGFYQNGRYARPLANGQASLVIDRQGRVTVGAWGTDIRMGADVVAVRQNLGLIVDGGRPVAGLSINANGRWGSAKNQYQYTWRSGLGTDAQGNLIYVAGDKMNLTTLASAMADAGVVRGMQLDIHTGMASFSSWQPSSGETATPTKLLPAMTRSAYRYLVPDQRDFVYLTMR